MSSVDNRIVNMQFNNKQFEAGAADSVKSLETLEQTLADLAGTDNMSDLGASVDQVATRFGALQVAGVAALATIASMATQTAVNLGKNLLGSITDTILGAGRQRAIDLEQAAFQFRGLGLNVDKTMNSALDAVRGTAYGLNEAALVAAQFGGAGIKAGEDMTRSLRGISGIAAQTGRSYTEIGQVMTGIAGVGRVTSQDLIQFGVRGLNVAAAMGKELGKTEAEIREMVSEGQISFKEFAFLMDDAFGENATKANQTFTGSLANVKAALSRIGADIAAPRLAGLKQIFQELAPVIDQIHEALEPLINQFGRFQKESGRAIGAFLKSLNITRLMGPILDGLQNIAEPFIELFNTIGEAWLQVFPNAQHRGKQAIFGIASAFELLTTPLSWIAKLIPYLMPLFVGLFEVLKFGISIIRDVATGFEDFADKAKGIGENIIGGILEGFNASSLKTAIENFATSIVEWIKGALGINSPAAELIPVGTAIVQGIAQGIVEATKWVGQALATVIGAIITGIGDLFGDMDAIDWTVLFNAILTGGLILTMRKTAKLIQGFVGGLTETMENLSSPFNSLTEALNIMQTQVRAQLILNIAIAVGVLTAAIIALSLLGPKKIAIGIGAIATTMGLLAGTMFLLGKINPEGLFAMGAAVLLISNAMLIMAGAIAILGNLGLDTLGKGLGAMAIGLGIMVVALRAMTGLGPGLPAAAAAIVLMAAAMTIMSAAVAALGNMDMGTLAKGLGAMAIGLTLFTAALLVLGGMGPGVAAAGAGIFIVASAMTVMSAAVLALGKMKMGTLAKGLGAIAIGLTLFTVALAVLTAMGPGVVAAAAGVFIMAAAMLVMATAIGAIGSMSIGDIAKGLAALAVGFVILLAAGYAAIGLAPGLLTLGVTVLMLGAGMALLGAGLLAAATAFAIFAAVGAAGIGVLISGFGAFLTLLPQIALQLATAFVVFIEAIAAAAPRLREAFGEILQGILGTIQDAIPEIRNLVNALLDAIVDVITKNIPRYGKIFTTLIQTGLKVMRELIPAYVRTGLAIIEGVLRGIADKLPKIIDAGVDVIVNFVQGIGDAAGRIATAAGDAMLDFLNEIEAWLERNHDEFVQTGRSIAFYIAEGLSLGLISAENLQKVKDAAVSLADAAKGAFTGPLGFIIDSPSKVAIYWGEMIVDGLVKGIGDNVKKAVGMSIYLANAAISAGDKAIAAAQKKATKRQISAEKAAARADISERLARQAEREASKSPNNKALQKAANEARKLADKQAKAAATAQRKADAAAQKVLDTQAFREADAQGKGDILTDRAKELSDRAIKKLAEANAAAQAAKKATGKERERLLREAKRDAKIADRLAEQSKNAQKRASEFYAEAVKDRIRAINEARRQDEKDRRQEEKFENATDEERAEILQKRAEATQKRSEAAQKQSEALVKQARKLAKKDAARAQRLLDRAERLAQRASDDADEAKQLEQDAQDYANKGVGSGFTFNLSTSAMEDAASAIDRYTKSLQQAEEAAAATTPVYQFVQYNTSPESLNDTAVYRQTKNLLSAAEIKMAETS